MFKLVLEKAKELRTPREFDFGGQWETEPDLPMSVQESPVEEWIHSWPQGTRPHPSTTNWVKDLHSLAPPVALISHSSKVMLKILQARLQQYVNYELHYFANKGPSSQGYGFSCGHVWM